MIDKKELVNYLMNWRASLGKTFQDDVISIVLDIILKKVESFDCDEKLKELEDLEEQGLLLRLPCKVGDVVYQIMFFPKKGKCEIVEGIVEEIYYKHAIGYRAIRIKVRNTDHTLSVWDDYDFGKNVLPTKAEAEKALAEMG